MTKPEPVVVAASKAKIKQTQKPDSLLHRMIAFEGEVLGAQNRLMLKHIAVNKPRILLPIGHAFLCTRRGRHFSVEAISNQAVVNNQAPFLQWLKHILKSTAKHEDHDFSKPFAFNLKTRRADDDFEYPYSHAYWAPFSPDIHGGGLLLTRDTPWEEAEHSVLARIGQIIGVNWTALAKTKAKPMAARRKYIGGGLAILGLITLAIPVSVTTMAPAEIIAKDPFIVTAPMDGVIETLHVKPGTLVEKGTVLATLNDTAFRNEYTLSGEEKAVAAARYRQASLTAFIDQNSKRDLAVSSAEQTLAAARQDYAADRLAKTRLIANRSGLVIYSDEKDWAGRPVATGEKIMQIADPTRVLLRLLSPIADSDALRSGARVRMFLDAEPLAPIEAKLTRANFYAQPQPGGQLAYEAYADLTGAEAPPRIGGRGVAKIYGSKAPFGYWLLRRPISSARQFLGL